MDTMEKSNKEILDELADEEIIVAYCCCGTRKTINTSSGNC